MRHTGKKETKKETKKYIYIFKIRLREICFKGIRTRTLYPLDHLGKRWQAGLKEVYLPSLWWLTVFKWLFFFFFNNFRVELNLSLIETSRKAHNKPINTLSGLVHAGERLRNLRTIDHAATDWTVRPYDTLPARKVSFHRSGKTLTQHCSTLFPLF